MSFFLPSWYRPVHERWCLRPINWRHRGRCGRPTWHVTPVVCHVRLDEMTRTQRTIQTEFTRKHTCGNDAGKLPCIVTRGGWVSATHAEEVKHGGLGLENGATANGANFY